VMYSSRKVQENVMYSSPGAVQENVMYSSHEVVQENVMYSSREAVQENVMYSSREAVQGNVMYSPRKAVQGRVMYSSRQAVRCCLVWFCFSSDSAPLRVGGGSRHVTAGDWGMWLCCFAWQASLIQLRKRNRFGYTKFFVCSIGEAS